MGKGRKIHGTKLVAYEDKGVSNSFVRESYAKRRKKQNANELEEKNKRTDDEVTDPGEAEAPEITSTTPISVNFDDIGGISGIKDDLWRLIGIPLVHSEVYDHLCGEEYVGNIRTPTGILVIGPPGCGKTVLVNAVANWLKKLNNINFFKITGPELIGGLSGDSENQIRRLFKAATASSPSLIFVDEIDTILPKRDEVQREMEKRIVSQFLSCMDDLYYTRSPVLVVGATNRPNALDPAAKRNGRFDREIHIGIPNLKSRQEIIEILLRGIKVSANVNSLSLAQMTPGFVGADIVCMVREAMGIAVERICADLNISGDKAGGINMDVDLDNSLSKQVLAKYEICQQDFEEAIVNVQPSAKSEGFATVPDVTWDNVGAMHEARSELDRMIVRHINYPELYEKFNLKKSAGALLYGPPGCGKTLIAKAIANETNANFISIKGPELLNKYVGESERAVRQVFQRARDSAPCIIFFDELDALAPRRSSSRDGNMVSERVVNQLLTELDGLSDRKSVFVLGATNRPDIIDHALLRPGRFDKLILISLPNEEDRVDILEAISRNTPKAGNVDFRKISPHCHGYSGADLSALVREASMMALGTIIEDLQEKLGKNAYSNQNKQMFYSEACITQENLIEALRKVRPSVNLDDALYNEKNLLSMNMQDRSFEFSDTSEMDSVGGLDINKRNPRERKKDT